MRCEPAGYIDQEFASQYAAPIGVRSAISALDAHVFD
jgi:hypothetical protein